MNKQQAQQIIRDTFENSFNKSRFAGFIKNLLNRIDEAPFTYQGNYIPDAYKQYIKTLERIGKYSDGENNIDILVITLQKDTSLERARTMQRNFIAWYLNGSRGGEMKDAALAAFVSPYEEDWRFSLVKMDYKFEKTKTGRMKVKEEFTPARRWSFLVGANEKSHTAQSRLVSILADDEQAPLLEQIEKAFDIETVTKEFFLKYRELFLRTKEELDKVVKKDPKIKADFADKGVDTVNFAKKLLGQIVFLYFLQKKGWFGAGRDDNWGTGSKHFLRELFIKKHSDYDNFYDDILEPLFYEALRIDRSHDDDYYSRFNCKIPFLNGGLFDPIGNYDWVHTDIIIPDKLFSNFKKTKEGDTGDGILDIFDRYNFTVKEDEPLEKEVAIDPELLGKAYEKFNAIRPDNYAEFKKALSSGKTGEENKFNKKFGVYYTPREIVHYMCQQSLINYLVTELNGNANTEDIETLIHTGEQVSENEARVIGKGKETKTYSHKLPESIRKNAKLIDEKLADITVCDPAVGSGAFPVGMMNEIVRTRNVLTTFLKDKGRTPYEFKRRAIEHSLYGVDIDPGAVEIAKLRLWLSLVVDEDDIKNIKPLPNLDYRIMQGNSLISEFMGINFDSKKERSTENLMFKDETHGLIEQFQKKKDEFLNESNVLQKTKLKNKVDGLLIEIFETKLKTQKADYFNRLQNIENKYSVLRNENQKLKLIRQDKEKLYKETGFDLESAEIKLKEFTSGKRIKPFFLWNLYFSEVFHRKGGFDVVIGNPPYYNVQTLGAGHPIVHHLKDKYSEIWMDKSDILFYFIYRGSQISKHQINFIISNAFLFSAKARKLRNYMIDVVPIETIINFEKCMVFGSASITSCISFFNKQKSNNETKAIVFKESQISPIDLEKKLNQKADAFMVSFEKNSVFALTPSNIGDLHEKIDANYPKLSTLLKVGKGMETAANKVFCFREFTGQFPKKHVKYRMSGEIIKKYHILKPVEYVLYFEDVTAFDELPNVIKQHLNRHREYLSNRATVRNEGHSWWKYSRALHKDYYHLNKLWCSYRSRNNCFAYDDTGQFIGFTNTTVIFDTGENLDLRYVLALLNSSTLDFRYKTIGKQTGSGVFEYFENGIGKLPIPIGNPEKERVLVGVVDKILEYTKSEAYLEDPQKQKKVKALEAEIDQLVYKLFDLTPKEIEVVEGKT